MGRADDALRGECVGEDPGNPARDFGTTPAGHMRDIACRHTGGFNVPAVGADRDDLLSVTVRGADLPGDRPTVWG